MLSRSQMLKTYQPFAENELKSSYNFFSVVIFSNVIVDYLSPFFLNWRKDTVFKSFLCQILNVPNTKSWYMSAVMDMPITLIWSFHMA